MTTQKIVTKDLCNFDDFPRNREIAELAIQWFKDSRPSMTAMGFSWKVNSNPEEFDGYKPSLQIEVTAQKSYLGVDEVRTQGTQLRAFAIGALYAFGMPEFSNSVNL